MKRVFLIVLDSFGIGYEPDADKFGDMYSNTLKTISDSPGFSVPNMENLGLSLIDGVDYLNKPKNLIGSFARLQEKSNGKDTTTGHWEIAGLISENPMPTFPDGFPDEILREIENETGVGFICNKVYSGTEVIKDYGEEHIKTGKLIVYTSSDSVFQIAAHEDVVPVEKLYEYCKIARKHLVGKYAMGRVIARPFDGEYPFIRSKKRHDFSLEPFGKTVLDSMKEKDFDVISVGKISDIFAGKGITESHYTTDNNDGMMQTQMIAERDFNGICFTNLVDFDMLYGHRRDADGYANALMEFDTWLGNFIKKLKDDDLLMITADHGCDPAFKGTDHTREYVPLLIYGNKTGSKNLGTVQSFSSIASTISDIFDLDYKAYGESLWRKINDV